MYSVVLANDIAVAQFLGGENSDSDRISDAVLGEDDLTSDETFNSFVSDIDGVRYNEYISRKPFRILL